MENLTAKSKGMLGTCHVDLKLIFNTVAERFRHTIFCGYRNEISQTKVYDDGLSTYRFPESKHNQFPSLAPDAGPYIICIKRLSWDDHLAFAHFAGYVKCVAEDLLEKGLVTHRLRWGGDHDLGGLTLDEKFLELVHFELIRV